MTDHVTDRTEDFIALLAAASPIALWYLDEASGSVMYDYSGNSRDGTYVETEPDTLFLQDFAFGGGLAPPLTPTAGFWWFDGAAAAPYAAVADAAWMDDVVAVAAYLYPGTPEATDTGEFHPLVSRANSTDEAWSIGVQSQNPTSYPNYNVWPSFRITTDAGTVTLIAEIDAWVFECYTVGTWDGATARLYVNGIEYDSAALGGTLLAPAADIIIGADGDLATTYATGDIAWVSVYDTIPTVEEMRAAFRVSLGCLDGGLVTATGEADADVTPGSGIYGSVTETVTATGTATALGERPIDTDATVTASGSPDARTQIDHTVTANTGKVITATGAALMGKVYPGGVTGEATATGTASMSRWPTPGGGGGSGLEGIGVMASEAPRRLPPTAEERREVINDMMTAGTRRGESRTLRPISPVAAAPTVLSDGSGALQWYEDQFESSDALVGSYPLTYIPLPFSEDVEVNGLRVPRGRAWSRDDDSDYPYYLMVEDPALFFHGDGPWWVSVHYLWTTPPTVYIPT